MTDRPTFGFLCTGKTPLELSISIHCAGKLRTLLRENGFVPGGYYTEIVDYKNAAGVRRTGRTLEHLANVCDLVLTVGCQGFSEYDVIPDITDVVASSKAAYFAGVLCGAEALCVPEETLKASAKYFYGATRQFSKDDGQASSDPMPQELSPKMSNQVSDEHAKDTGAKALCDRLCAALEKIRISNPSEDALPDGEVFSRINASSFTKLFLGAGRYPHTARFRTSDSKDACRPSQSSGSSFSAPPSRASAGIRAKALILNLSNEVYTSTVLVSALMPAIGFAVFGLSGKSAADCAAVDREFEKTLNSEPFAKNKFVVNK